MSGDPFRSPAEMATATGRCGSCGAEVERSDLVFDIDGTLRCRACERPLPVVAPLYRDATIQLRLGVGYSVAVVLTVVLSQLWSCLAR